MDKRHPIIRSPDHYALFDTLHQSNFSNPVEVLRNGKMWVASSQENRQKALLDFIADLRRMSKKIQLPDEQALQAMRIIATEDREPSTTRILHSRGFIYPSSEGKGKCRECLDPSNHRNEA